MRPELNLARRSCSPVARSARSRNCFRRYRRKKNSGAGSGRAALRPPEPNASPTPSNGKPKFEARVDVQVDKTRQSLSRCARANDVSSDLLGDMAIDITQGTESLRPRKRWRDVRGRTHTRFGEAASKMLEVIKPVAAEATNTMKELRQTSRRISAGLPTKIPN